MSINFQMVKLVAKPKLDINKAKTLYFTYYYIALISSIKILL